MNAASAHEVAIQLGAGHLLATTPTGAAEGFNVAALLAVIAIAFAVGAATYALTIFRNRRRLEQRLDDLSAELELLRDAESKRLALETQLREGQKLEAIGQLAGGIAHDFNNLLTAIIGNAELLRIAKGTIEEQREELDEIMHAGRRGAELVRQLLSFARRSPGHIVPIDLHQSVEDTVSLLRRGTSALIFVNIAVEGESPIIEADPATFENALLNLGLNARDAMPEGGHITYRVKRVSHRLDLPLPKGAPPDLALGDWAHIRIEDTGTGMDEEVKTHLFEPFYTTKAPGKGTGLGLASVYGTVKQLRGRIVVDSEIGKGTTFHLWVPLSDKEAFIEGVVDPSEVRRRAGHILLVDDDDAVRAVAQKLLTELGCQVSTAVDGLEALDFYQEHRREIDLVVLDLQMPNLDGRGTFRELKRLDPKVRVLLTSGHASREEAERIIAEGALDVLPKPFKLDDLSRAIARYGRLRRSPTLPQN